MTAGLCPNWFVLNSFWRSRNAAWWLFGSDHNDQYRKKSISNQPVDSLLFTCEKVNKRQIFTHYQETLWMLIQPVQSKEAVRRDKGVSISAFTVFHCFFSLKFLWVYGLAANCPSFMIGFQRPEQVLAHTFKLDSLPQLHLHLCLSCSGWFSALYVCDEIDFTELLSPFLPWFLPHNSVPL